MENIKNTSCTSVHIQTQHEGIKKSTKKQDTTEGLRQFSSGASLAARAYAMPKISASPKAAAAKATETVTDSTSTPKNGEKTINFFYFSDMHGELSGLAKLAAAESACETLCGGPEHLTVLAAGDLIAGSQQNVIQGTVAAVNKMGLEATAVGNHEKGRSNTDFNALAAKLEGDMLAVNASQEDKGNLKIASSKVCRQGDTEFIAIGALPQYGSDYSGVISAIDTEVAEVRAKREAAGQDPNIPVVFLSHLGSEGDAAVAQNSTSVNLILGGHTHKTEQKNITSADGRSVHVVQQGANNAHATMARMVIGADGQITASSQIADLSDSTEKVCSHFADFCGAAESSEPAAVAKAEEVKRDTAGAITEAVGEAETPVIRISDEVDITHNDSSRTYSNPVLNVLADAMLEQTADRGVEVAFFQAPTLKDTTLKGGRDLTNYEVMSRMLPFGGSVVTAELSIEQFYEVIEEYAETLGETGESQLPQCAGMVYTVNAEKAYNIAPFRHESDSAAKTLKKAIEGGDPETIATARSAYEKAHAAYSAMPKAVEKILILTPDGREIKINPKAIARGDYQGQTIKCAMNDYVAKKSLDKGQAESTGRTIRSVFEQKLSEIGETEGTFSPDHNDIRIAVKGTSPALDAVEDMIDPNEKPVHHPSPTTINSQYWYNRKGL